MPPVATGLPGHAVASCANCSGKFAWGGGAHSIKIVGVSEANSRTPGRTARSARLWGFTFATFLCFYQEIKEAPSALDWTSATTCSSLSTTSAWSSGQGGGSTSRRGRISCFDPRRRSGSGTQRWKPPGLMTWKQRPERQHEGVWGTADGQRPSLVTEILMDVEKGLRSGQGGGSGITESGRRNAVITVKVSTPCFAARDETWSTDHI